MKKILLTLSIALTATLSYAQKRTIDWSVETIVSPTIIQSTASNGSPFAYDIACKNNGTDTVKVGDTITYQFLIQLGTSGIPIPGGGQIYIRIATKDIAPNDTMHLSGNINFLAVIDLSSNITFHAASGILNRKADGVTAEGAGTNANNQKSAPMAWMNQHGWGVSVTDVRTSNLNIYPNPSSNGMINVSPLVQVYDNMEVEILDLNGRVVYSQTFSKGEIMDINTENFEKGMYIVQVKNGDLISTSKVSIQ